MVKDLGKNFETFFHLEDAHASIFSKQKEYDLFQTKDKVWAESKSCAFYKYACEHCDKWTYIGISIRRYVAGKTNTLKIVLFLPKYRCMRILRMKKVPKFFPKNLRPEHSKEQ